METASFVDKVRKFFTDTYNKLVDYFKRFKLWCNEKFRNLKNRFSRSNR